MIPFYWRSQSDGILDCCCWLAYCHHRTRVCLTTKSSEKKVKLLTDNVYDNMEHLDPVVSEVHIPMNFSDMYSNAFFPSRCFDFNQFDSGFYHLPLVNKFWMNIGGEKFLDESRGLGHHNPFVSSCHRCLNWGKKKGSSICNMPMMCQGLCKSFLHII